MVESDDGWQVQRDDRGDAVRAARARYDGVNGGPGIEGSYWFYIGMHRGWRGIVG